MGNKFHWQSFPRNLSKRERERKNYFHFRHATYLITRQNNRKQDQAEFLFLQNPLNGVESMDQHFETVH